MRKLYETQQQEQQAGKSLTSAAVELPLMNWPKRHRLPIVR